MCPITWKRDPRELPFPTLIPDIAIFDDRVKHIAGALIEHLNNQPPPGRESS